MAYDPTIIQRFYDGYGDREWNRFDRRAQDQVNLHVHLHYLSRFIEPGMNVLDAGAGPGRFTIEMARKGASVTVVDLSREMLAQNEQRLQEAGVEHAVRARHHADICDLSLFESESFDAVVCYGGPLSYVKEKADDALAELLRVARPGAPVLLSVMSTIGSTRYALPAIVDIAARIGNERVAQVLEDGVLDDLFRNDHVLKMYRWVELEAMLERHPCRLEVASAGNFLTNGRPETIPELVPDPKAWEALLEWEVRSSSEPGALDGGSHILAIVRKIDSADRHRK